MSDVVKALIGIVSTLLIALVGAMINNAIADKPKSWRVFLVPSIVVTSIVLILTLIIVVLMSSSPSDLSETPTATTIVAAQTPLPAPTSVPTHSPSTPDSPPRFDQVGQFHPSNNRDDVFIAVASIESDGSDRTRWNFVIWNQSDEEISVWFDDQDSYLVDEQGNQYPVLRMKTGLHTNVSAGVREELWMDFSAPRNGTRRFAVVLNSVSTFDGANFDPFEVTLP